jgi:uncharacterized protein (DUF111 family)
VGGIDAIVDIACCAVAADALDLDGWYCSPVNVGSGFVNCAHGRFPVPAPATAELLKNLPSIRRTCRQNWSRPPARLCCERWIAALMATPVMRTQAIGYGAGTRNPERFPNVLRVSIGEDRGAHPFNQDKVTVLECAVDDLSPQVLAHTAQLALERGALDVMSSPVTMKKGRWEHCSRCFARPAMQPICSS